jgi:hypothetical protein
MELLCFSSWYLSFLPVNEYEHINEYINHNNVLNDKQFGFWPNSSTEKASFKLIDDILKSEQKMFNWWDILRFIKGI